MPPGSDRRRGRGSSSCQRSAFSGTPVSVATTRYRVPAGRVAAGGHEDDDGIERQVWVALGRRRAAVVHDDERRADEVALVAGLCERDRLLAGRAVDPPTVRLRRPASISYVEGLARADGILVWDRDFRRRRGVGVGSANGTGCAAPISPFGSCVAGAPSPRIATTTRATTDGEE